MIKDSISVYRNEEIAIEAFKEYRMQKGIFCKKCGCRKHYWLGPKHQFQCKDCRFRTTLRSGSILEGSKLPISYFFIAIHLLLKYQNSITIQILQEYTEHKYFEPLWYFLRNIRENLKEEEQKQLMLHFWEVVNLHLLKLEKTI
jgi:hypothetical protein